MITGAQQLAVIITCLLAATTNAGAVTPFALAVFVLPGVVLTAAIGSFLVMRRMSGAALVLGGLGALGWSELVNIWSGTADGPAARATFVAAGCTVVAVVVARTHSPGLFLLAVAGSVCGALLLGAGGEVRIVAVATVAAAALTLGSIESSRRNWTSKPQRGPALVLLSVLVAAVAAGTILLQAQRDARQPDTLSSGRAYPGIKPPWTDPLGMTATRLDPVVDHRDSERLNPRPETERHRPPAVRERPTTKEAPTRPLHTLWPYVLAALLLALLALAGRLLAVRFAWRRLRRRLAAGAVAEQVTGAWAWIRMRLEACRLPLAAAVSPDAVAAGGAEIILPREVAAPLQRLAQWTTVAAFANGQPFTAADAAAAWQAARQTDASARRLMTRRARVRLAFRGPTLREAR